MSFISDDEASSALGRLFNMVSPEPNSGCWIWTGHIDKGGYGKTCLKGRSILAHRATYVVTKGPVPEGLELDHKCRVRCCVNPDHLEAVTKQENWLRSEGPRLVKERFAAQSHCVNGHPRTPDNLYIIPRADGHVHRRCRTCAILREREKRRRRRDAA